MKYHGSSLEGEKSNYFKNDNQLYLALKHNLEWILYPYFHKGEKCLKQYNRWSGSSLSNIQGVAYPDQGHEHKKDYFKTISEISMSITPY